MKILYITQYFHPEIGATTNRALANVRYLSDKGHNVTVLTEMPNHPKGKIFDGYTKKIFLNEKMGRININRVWVYTNDHKTFSARLLFYLSFMFLGFIHTLFNWKEYDIIYITSPPLFVGSIGLALKKVFRKAKFVFEVRDLWPDAAIEMGELKNKKLISFSYTLENLFYKNANHIVTVTKNFKIRVIKKGYPRKKITVIRNGSDLSFKEILVSKKLKNQFHPSKNFIVVYAGILGLAQNLQTVLDAAKKVERERVIFLLLGTGPKSKELKKYAERIQVNNVVFLGEIPKVNVSEYLSLANCGIIPLKNIKVFESTIPSKLFDYMSANLPIILGVKGEAAMILAQSEAGITYDPDNSEDLAQKIIYLKNNLNLLMEMKKRGRKFVKKNYNRELLASNLEKLLMEIYHQ